jgi:glycosyltransferase involved in cell wall biosynthesis
VGFSYHSPMRLAVFSPLPPVRSGISDYTVELLTALGGSDDVDVFVASRAELARWPAGSAPFAVRSAHDFVWASVRTPYDAVVYQMGNAWCHDYMWPYLFAYPGVVVLHDGHLHHARAWSLLRRGRQDDYRAELAFNHPSLSRDAAEIALSGFAGPIYYQWPMLRAVVESAKMVLVHNGGLGRDLSETHPAARVRTIAMGVADPRADEKRIAAARARCGCGPETVLVSAFGAITEEKRIEPLLAAVSVARRYVPDLRLALVGQTMAHFDVGALAARLGVDGILATPGYVDDDDLPAFLAASDVVAALRWPSGRETSASWLRAMAAGRATIITELAQQADLPTYDPRSWTVATGDASAVPVAVGIDILDEHHSLTLALKRLAADAKLRDGLGQAARAWWAERHTLAHMTADYRRELQDAAQLTPPSIELPAHLRPQPDARARALLAAFPGVALMTQPIPPDGGAPGA